MIICNMKHIQSAKVEKISKCFIFKNLIIFWENSEWYGAQKKSTKLRWIIQYTAIFGRYGSTAKIVYFEPDFSQTWNFQGLFLAILSTIFESFSKIVGVLFEKWLKNHWKMHIFVKFWTFQIFFGKTLSWVSSPYSKELSCKKSKKSLEPFSRKTGN